MATSNSNTNMKACFSLSSLHPDHPSGHNTSPVRPALREENQRLYNSLTKRPKRPWPENSAGLDSPVSSKDEFWAAIQRDYNYLMGRQLIDSCCQELLANNSQHSPMNTSAESPSCEMLDLQPTAASIHISDVETELGGIKQWLNDAEERLGPGVTECRNRLGKETLPPGTPFVLRRDAKMLEHKSLQLDIESRGKALTSLLRLCKHLCENPSSGVSAAGDCISSSSTALSSTSSSVPPRRGARALKLAQRLEKRWQILYLKNLEWILHLEKSTADPASSEAATDSDEDEQGVTPARKKRLVEVMSPDVCTKGEQMLDMEAQMRFTQSGKSSLANSSVYYYKHSTTEYSSEEDDDTGWTFRPRLQPARGSSVCSSSSNSSSQPLSEPGTSSSSSCSEDLNASVATCIGGGSSIGGSSTVVMRPKRSPQRVKRRPVSLPFSLMSPEAATTPPQPTSKTCSETNLAVLARRKRTMRRSKRRLMMASSSESEDKSAVVRSSSFSGTIYKSPSPKPDGCHSDPSSCHRLRRPSGRLLVIAPPIPVAEESGEPSWDNYQERYNSEAYSEDPLDAEAARKLLEFGDDYSRYLRDCSSPVRRVSGEAVGQDSSDSEVEELRYVLKLSQESLAYTSQRLQSASERFDNVVAEALGPDSIVSIGELSEMAATCRESRKCVELVITRIEQEAAGVADMQLIYELLEQWEDLESRTQELQRASSLARDVAALRQSMVGVTGALVPLEETTEFKRQSRLESRICLQGKLEAVREQLASMSGVKGQLVEMNSLIQRLATEDNGAITQQIKSVLRGQIAELFEMWEMNNQRLCAELGRTQQHLADWQELDRQLSMLRGCLLRDRENLLTRTKDDSGSLSDSGISDAGSDVLEARGQELMTLRALADQLPAHTRKDIVQELDAAEKELEQLRLYSSQKNLACLSSTSHGGGVVVSGSPCGGNDDDGVGKEAAKHWPRHWLKLVPLCVVTLVAVVCSFLQPPNCCEYVDSSGKYWELLKLQHGPPPV